MAIGDNVKAIRKEKKLTQMELANKMGISRSYLGDIENNRKNPSSKTLEMLAEKLNVSTYYLLEGKSEEERWKESFHMQDIQELNDLNRKIEQTKGSPEDLERKERLERRIYKYENAGKETFEKLTDTHKITFNVPAFETIHVNGAPINQPISEEEALKRFFDLKRLIRALVPQSTYEGNKLTHNDAELLLTIIKEVEEKFEFNK